MELFCSERSEAALILKLVIEEEEEAESHFWLEHIKTFFGRQLIKRE
jgi:hypothetical protein